MILNLTDNVWMAEIPLPNSPLKALNLFVIKDKDRNVIVDSGFNRTETKEAFLQAMEELNLEFSNTVLFLTHLHSDHTGLASFCEEHGMEVIMGKVDGDLLNQSMHVDDFVWVNTLEHSKLQGLAVDNLHIEDHPGYAYRPLKKVNFHPAMEGEKLSTGKYEFEYVFLPGHTPGLTALYEPKQGWLFSGDHILGKITPNITFWGFEYGDILGTYLQNLDRVKDMDIGQIFSSHRYLLKDYRARIETLKHHHEERLEEAMSILRKGGESTVRNITKDMHWDIRSKDWADFPKPQKWFAAGEAHAHMERLRALGAVDMRKEDGVLYYCAK